MSNALHYYFNFGKRTTAPWEHNLSNNFEPDDGTSVRDFVILSLTQVM